MTYLQVGCISKIIDFFSKIADFFSNIFSFIAKYWLALSIGVIVAVLIIVLLKILVFKTSHIPFILSLLVVFACCSVSCLVGSIFYNRNKIQLNNLSHYDISIAIENKIIDDVNVSVDFYLSEDIESEKSVYSYHWTKNDMNKVFEKRLKEKTYYYVVSSDNKSVAFENASGWLDIKKGQTISFDYKILVPVKFTFEKSQKHEEKSLVLETIVTLEEFDYDKFGLKQYYSDGSIMTKREQAYSFVYKNEELPCEKIEYISLSEYKISVFSNMAQMDYEEYDKYIDIQNKDLEFNFKYFYGEYNTYNVPASITLNNNGEYSIKHSLNYDFIRSPVVRIYLYNNDKMEKLKLALTTEIDSDFEENNSKKFDFDIKAGKYFYVIEPIDKNIVFVNQKGYLEFSLLNEELDRQNFIFNFFVIDNITEIEDIGLHNFVVDGEFFGGTRGLTKLIFYTNKIDLVNLYFVGTFILQSTEQEYELVFYKTSSTNERYTYFVADSSQYSGVSTKENFFSIKSIKCFNLTDNTVNNNINISLKDSYKNNFRFLDFQNFMIDVDDYKLNQSNTTINNSEDYMVNFSFNHEDLPYDIAVNKVKMIYKYKLNDEIVENECLMNINLSSNIYSCSSKLDIECLEKENFSISFVIVLDDTNKVTMNYITDVEKTKSLSDLGYHSDFVMSLVNSY